MAHILTEVERAVLTVLARNDDAWLNTFYHEIVAAAKGDLPRADAICRNLRKRKLLEGSGRGKWVQYGITDAGKAALCE